MKICRRFLEFILVVAILAPLAGCRVEQTDPPTGKQTAGSQEKPKDFATMTSLIGDKPMTISITSTAFADGERIPKRYTGEGEDVSPPLAWSGLPQGTKELAIICEDPDAPTAEPWVHWVIYKIPATSDGLPEGIAQKARLKSPAGIFQGQNSWSKPGKPMVGYRGPLPPPSHGMHHYHFTICALDAKLIIDPGVPKKALLEEMRDHVLEMGCLTGLYSR